MDALVCSLSQLTNFNLTFQLVIAVYKQGRLVFRFLVHTVHTLIPQSSTTTIIIIKCSCLNNNNDWIDQVVWNFVYNKLALASISVACHLQRSNGPCVVTERKTVFKCLANGKIMTKYVLVSLIRGLVATCSVSTTSTWLTPRCRATQHVLSTTRASQTATLVSSTWTDASTLSFSRWGRSTEAKSLPTTTSFQSRMRTASCIAIAGQGGAVASWTNHTCHNTSSHLVECTWIQTDLDWMMKTTAVM